MSKQDIFNKPYVIVTFATTTDAIAGEYAFKHIGVDGRLIPVPGFIKAGCGMCWYSSIFSKNQIQEYIKNNKITYEQIFLKE